MHKFLGVFREGGLVAAIDLGDGLDSYSILTSGLEIRHIRGREYAEFYNKIRKQHGERPIDVELYTTRDGS